MITLHKWVMAGLFTILSWMVVSKFILEMSLVTYLLIEITIVILLKIHKFVEQQTLENPTDLEESNQDIPE